MQCDKAQNGEEHDVDQGMTIGFFLCSQIHNEVVSDREGSTELIVKQNKEKRSDIQDRQ